jgi:hypothetical protein
MFPPTTHYWEYSLAFMSLLLPLFGRPRLRDAPIHVHVYPHYTLPGTAPGLYMSVLLPQRAS